MRRIHLHWLGAKILFDPVYSLSLCHSRGYFIFIFFFAITKHYELFKLFNDNFIMQVLNFGTFFTLKVVLLYQTHFDVFYFILFSLLFCLSAYMLVSMFDFLFPYWSIASPRFTVCPCYFLLQNAAIRTTLEVCMSVCLSPLALVYIYIYTYIHTLYMFYS